MIKCCKDCKERHPKCHDKCKRYLEEKAAYEAAKEAFRKDEEYYAYRRNLFSGH